MDAQVHCTERLIQADERVKTGLQFPHPSIALVPSAVEFADLLRGYELLPKGSQEGSIKWFGSQMRAMHHQND